MHTRRTFFYLPGLISLCFLPLFSIIYLWGEGCFKQYRMLSIYCSSVTDDTKNKSVLVFKRPDRHYVNHFITGQYAADTAVFYQLRSLFQKSSFSCDTSNGICIRFNRKATYASFVKILDIFKLEKWVYYQVCAQGIWVWNEEPLMLGPIVHVKYLFLNDCIMEPEQNLKQLQREAELKLATKYRDLLWNFWPVWIIFLFITVTVFVNKKYSN